MCRGISREVNICKGSGARFPAVEEESCNTELKKAGRALWLGAVVGSLSHELVVFDIETDVYAYACTCGSSFVHSKGPEAFFFGLPVGMSTALPPTRRNLTPQRSGGFQGWGGESNKLSPEHLDVPKIKKVPIK